MSLDIMDIRWISIFLYTVNLSYFLLFKCSFIVEFAREHFFWTLCATFAKSVTLCHSILSSARKRVGGTRSKQKAATRQLADNSSGVQSRCHTLLHFGPLLTKCLFACWILYLRISNKLLYVYLCTTYGYKIHEPLISSI